MQQKEKIKQPQKQQQISVKRISGISKRGKKVIFAGILVLIVGFFVLSKTDSQGQNWASILSPFLIVGAYIIIAIGIILPESNIDRSK